MDNPPTFSLQAEDPDLCDSLVVEWYVDYDQSNPSEPKGLDRPVPGSPTNTNAARDLSGTNYTLALGDFGTTAAQQLGTHVLEGLVSDGDMTVGPSGRQALARNAFQQCFPPEITVTLPDGGPAFDTTYYATYAWTVVIASTACP